MHFIEAMGLRVSITMIKYHDQKLLGRKGSISAYSSTSHSSSRDVKSGDQDRKLKQELK